MIVFYLWEEVYTQFFFLFWANRYVDRDQNKTEFVTEKRVLTTCAILHTARVMHTKLDRQRISARIERRKNGMKVHAKNRYESEKKRGVGNPVEFPFRLFDFSVHIIDSYDVH